MPWVSEGHDAGSDGADGRVDVAGELLAQEREGEAGEVGAAAGAADDHVGHLAGHLELQQCLLADHGLVQQDVVEHRPECVAGVLGLGRDLDRLGDRDAERAGVLGVLGEVAAAGLGQVAGGAVHLAAEGPHQHAAVGLLVERRTDLPDLAVEPENAAGKGERGSPLPGAGLGGQPAYAVDRVVVGLRHGGVGLVRADGRDALVLVVDVRGGVERLLEAAGAVQRRRPPQPVDVEHLAGDVDVALAGDLLRDQLRREQRCQVVGADRLQGARVQRRWRRLGQIRR